MTVELLPFLSTTVVEENGKVDPITNVSIVNDREVQSLTFARALMTKAENHHTAILVQNVHYRLLIFGNFTPTSPTLSTGRQFAKVKVTGKYHSTFTFIYFKTFMLN